MIGFRSGIVLIAAAVMLTGCLTNNLIPERFRSQQAGQANQSSASGVSSDTANNQSTEKATGDSEKKTEQALLTGATTEQAAEQPPTQTLGRADLLGGWKVTSGNENCQLFMSLTGWAGGYRAITKGCSSPILADVQAWILNGEEIALLSGRGDTVIRLKASGKTRLNGKTSDGKSVMVFR